jgi:hypothetical protein
MNRKAVISLVALLAGTFACGVPAGTPPTPIVVTQVVVIPNAGEPAQPPAPPPTSTPEIPLPTVTVQPVDTATSTATVTVTATLNGSTATFIKDANCRAGPGTKYDVITSYFKGQTVEIIGRNKDFSNTWWQIKIPTGGKCWVSLTTAQATGDFDSIPIVKP